MPLKPLITLETSPSSTCVYRHISSLWCLSNYSEILDHIFSCPSTEMSFWAWAPQSRRAGILFNTFILAILFLTSEAENAVCFLHVDWSCVQQCEFWCLQASLHNATVKVLWDTVCQARMAVLHSFEWPPSRFEVWCLMWGMYLPVYLDFWLLTQSKHSTWDMVSPVPSTKGLVRPLVRDPVTAWVAWLFRSFLNEINPNVQLRLFGKRKKGKTKFGKKPEMCQLSSVSAIFWTLL